MAEFGLKLKHMFSIFDLRRTLNFRKDEENLIEKLEQLKFLLVAAESQPNSGTTNDWLKKLETAIMDADDVLDEHRYQVLRSEIQHRDIEEMKVRNYPFVFFESIYFRIPIVLKIKNMNRTLENIIKESERNGMDKIGVDSTNWELKRYGEISPLEVNYEVLGREREVSEIVEVLVRHDQEVDSSVVVIRGLGGVGKTTLAREVFQSDGVARYFDEMLWITVSESFVADDILEEMLRCLNPIYHEESKGEAVVEMLRHDLSGKRYLLVLDDLQFVNQEKWDCMTRCLQGIGASKGNKILLTTRSYEVVSIMKVSLIYDVKPLSDDVSWKLFARIAFADEGIERYPELVEIGYGLVKRCRGSPLMIKTLAGFLCSRKSKHEWLMIKTSEAWVESEWTFSTGQLIYDSLPSLSLKRCFAYCSIFPKNAVIEREKIIQQWMAQGFLNSSKEFEMEMEETGNYYFHLLLQISFLEVAKKDDYDNVISFKMHDIIHDFAVHIAKNFCYTLNGDMETGESDAVHLSIISKDGHSCKIPKGKFQKLRTLYLIGGVLDDKLPSLTHVRVLVLENLEVRELPNSIGDLRHLRYLDISRTMIRRLPHSIIKLQNLQTLRLHALEEFPKKFNHLINLRHLYIDSISSELSACFIPGIRHLVHLQTLPYFIVDRDMGFQIDELEHLSNLKGDLKIFGLQHIKDKDEAMKADLSKKANVKWLEFRWDDVAEEFEYEDILDGLKPHLNLRGLTIVNYPGSKFSSWITVSGPSQFNYLVQLRLENCNRCDEIPAIGHLPSLKIVEFYRINNVKVIGSSFYGVEYLDSVGYVSIAFPSLKRLSLSGMPKLVEWLEPGHPSIEDICPKMEELTIGGCLSLTHLPEMSKFSSLQRLSISSCAELSSLPEGIGSLASLEYLGISKCPALALIPDASGLVSLRFLSIVDCMMLTSLPHGLMKCNLLESLSLLSCPALRPEALQCLQRLNKLEMGYFSDELDYFPWPYAADGASSSKVSGYIEHRCEFKCLTSVKLYGWPKLASLPQQLEHLPSLRDLTICLFDGLVALPEWLCNVKTLEILELQECSNLTTFPSSDAMKCLIKLQCLKILYCPLLEERCIKGNGSEWPKIAHVPHIYINNKLVLSQR